MKKFIIATFLGVVGMTHGSVVHAQASQAQSFAQNAGLATTDLPTFIANLVRYLTGFLGILLVLYLLYAGFLWMNARGNGEQIKKAQTIIRNASIGLLVMIASFSLATFVLSVFSDASGNGGTVSSSSSTSGGGGFGSSGYGSASNGVFKVDSINPSGSIGVRNATVKVYFNQNIASSTANGNVLVQDQAGNNVAGSLSVNGPVVEFVPSANCPAPNTSLKCFDANKEYNVVVKSGLRGVKSDSGRELSCILGSVCKQSFKSGSVVDTQAPTASITQPSNGASVSTGTKVPVLIAAGDDAGLSVVELYKDNNLEAVYNFPSGATSHTARMTLDTTGISAGTNVSLKAVVKDLDSNTTNTQDIRVTVRAAHCFNVDGKGAPLQDADETGPNCGGADCAACAGAACTATSGCSTGACVGGVCQAVPVITDLVPGKVAPEGYITLVGSSFGVFDATKSKVNLIDSQGKKTALTFPAACTNNWTNTHIITQVPKGFADGSYDVEVITANTCGTQNCSDNTNNSNGTSKKQVVDKSFVTSNVCSITPARGSSQDEATITGTGFVSQSAVYFDTDRAQVLGGSTATKLSRVAVPNLLSGMYSVTVQSPYPSNAVGFYVPANTSRPEITSVSPADGGIGQYVTIRGKNFGNTQGTVFFHNNNLSNGRVAADVNFPAQCQNIIWTDSQITVKVPNIPNNTYTLSVKTNAASSAQVQTFTVNNKQPTPGVCALAPNQGPHGAVIDIIGDGLGAKTGSVSFLNETARITKWSAQLVQVEVPGAVQTGQVPVRLTTDGGDRSNALDFTVGACQQTGCNTPGYQCCADGTCAKSCAVAKPIPQLSWVFSTGTIPPIKIAPRVIEDQSCTATLQSPGPWIGSTEVCVNAGIVARFTEAIEMNSISASSVLVYKCTDRNTCALTPLSIIKKFNPVTNGTGDVEGFYAETTTLEKDTWYKVLLKGGKGFIAGKDGAVLENDYSWVFKTRNNNAPCDIDRVLVVPADMRMSTLGERRPVEGQPIGPNCTVLTNVYDWAWSSNDAAKVSVTQAKDASGKGSAKQTVTAIKETGEQKPVQVTAKVNKISDDTDVYVVLAEPEVLNYGPNCTDSCINATVFAQMNTAIDTNSLASNVYLYSCKNESCVRTDRTRILAAKPVFSTRVDPDTKANQYMIEFVNASNPSAPLMLQKDTFYQVEIHNTLKSKEGKTMRQTNFDRDGDGTEDSYAWIFRTEASGNVCGLNAVVVSPLSAIANHFGQIQQFVAEPVSAPNSCDPRGQVLNKFSYDWDWRTQGAGRVALHDSGKLKLAPISSPACTNTCLNAGSTTSLSVCGNGVLEVAEGCDDGNTTAGDGCSELCVFEGATSTCGNKKIDKGESCDDGNTTSGDGCSSSCLLEGSNAAYNSVCGNKSVGTGEECDDGNTTNGDGCSAICLKEGTSVTTATAICGNGKVEFGEDCDDSNILAGDGCSNRCLHEGSNKTYGSVCGNKLVETGEDCDDGNTANGDGCSEQCLREGSNILNGSVCGDARIKRTTDQTNYGEECDASSAVKGSPYQWATITGFINDKPGAPTSTEVITARADSKSGSANYILQCGFSRDSQCSSGYGVGSNTCCYERPKVVSSYPKNDPTGAQLSCTNSLVQVTFDQKMDGTSFVGNTILLEGHAGKCPAGQADFTKFLSQKEAEVPTWRKVVQAFGNFFGIDAIAAPKGTLWCQSTALLSTSLDQSGKILDISLDKPLNKNTFYKVILRGDSDLGDGVVAGIKSLQGVGFGTNTSPKFTERSVAYHVHAWEFKAGDLCELEDVEITGLDARDPSPYVFDKTNQSKGYLANAIDANGQKISPIKGVYDWLWEWSAGPSGLFSIDGAKTQASALAKNGTASGRGYAIAQASIKTSPYPATKCSENKECKSNQCVSQVGGPCKSTGGACGSVTNPTGSCVVTKAGGAVLNSFVCDNPWPATGSTYYSDTSYNIDFRYCRDNGPKVCIGGPKHKQRCNVSADCGSGVCKNDITDDLPVAQLPKKRVINGRVCESGTKAQNACIADADCPGSKCVDTNLLSESLFTLYKEAAVCHDGNGTVATDSKGAPKKCSSDAQCDQKAPFCYADAGKLLEPINDAIGLRILKNTPGFGIEQWYNTFAPNKGAFSSGSDLNAITYQLGGQIISLGYEQGVDGRSTYIGATNVVDPKTAKYFTNAYVFSHNDNSDQTTVDVYNQLISSIIFNSNISDEKVRAQIIRDSKRIAEINKIKTLLEAYKQLNGTYPTLQSGSYVSGQTYSTWPSWQRELGASLGGTISVDPLNEFPKCTGNEVTCWDATGLKFDPTLLDSTGRIKTGATLDTTPFVYQYRVGGQCSITPIGKTAQSCLKDTDCTAGVCENLGASYLLDYNREYLK